MSKPMMSACAWSIALLLLASCSKPAADSGAATAAATTSVILLATRPENAEGVASARQNKDRSEVLVEGRIGGSKKPFVDGMAAFTIVDLALEYCGTGETCPTPWDYCCAADLKENSALVKIAGADGAPMATDARQLLGVKELSRVIVQGRAERDENGNLTVLAAKVHVAVD